MWTDNNHLQEGTSLFRNSVHSWCEKNSFSHQISDELTILFNKYRLFKWELKFGTIHAVLNRIYLRFTHYLQMENFKTLEKENTSELTKSFIGLVTGVLITTGLVLLFGLLSL